jgi:gamma-glutamyl phosphate reductase
MEELSNKIALMSDIVFNENGVGMKKVLQDIYDMVDSNEGLIKEAYELDKEYSGRKESLKIKLILDDIEEIIDYEFKDSNVFESIDEKRVLETRQNLGVIGVFYDGDILLTIDIICKVLKTNNAVIFNVDMGKNAGTNNLIIKAVKEILRKNNKPENLVEINLSDNDNLLKEDLDLIIVVGSSGKRLGFSKLVGCKLLASGYGNSEIYVEDSTNKDFIKEILEKEDTKVDLYLKEGIDIGVEGIKVKDMYQAIKLINKNGAGYSSAIFTNDEDNAKKYTRKVKSKYVFVNASPTLARKFDIDIERLFYNKICIV